MSNLIHRDAVHNNFLDQLDDTKRRVGTLERYALTDATETKSALTVGSAAAATELIVNTLPYGSIANGIWIVIDVGTVECEVRKVTAITGKSLTVAALTYAHASSDPILYVYSNTINVKWFGAVGNASTDDTTAIQRALTAVPAYGKVLFPGDGNVYVTSAGLTIANKSSIELYSDGVAQIYMSSGTGDILDTNACPYMKISNIRITGAGTNAGRGLDVTDGYGLTLDNVWVYGAQYDQVHITSSWWVSTRDCTFSCLDADTGYVGFYHDTDSNAVVHIRSIFQGQGDCIGAHIQSGQGINFYGCDFSGTNTGSSTGLRIYACRGVSVKGCYFEWNGSYGVHIGSNVAGSPNNISITDCYFNLNDIENITGIYVHNNASYVTIDDNHFLGDSTTGSIGILVDQDAILHGIEIGYKNNFIDVETYISDAKYRADRNHDLRLSHDTQAPQNGVLYRKGDIIFNLDPADGDRVGWMPTIDNYYAVKGGWATSTAYTAGDFTGYGANIYRATSTGTSGATPPTHTSGDASDGTVTWRFITVGSFSTANFKGFGQVGYRSQSGTPVGSITPNFIGEMFYDSGGPPYWYIAFYNANTDWRSID